MTHEWNVYEMGTSFDTAGFAGFGSGTTVQGQSWTPPNGTNGVFQLGNGNSTNAIIFNELKFAAAKSIRTSTIILAVFNTIAAAATALGIFYECYSREKRNNRTFSFWKSGFSFIQSAEVFPFILSIGITFQGIIFAVAQAQGLNSLLARGCTMVAQFLLPGLFIVPYIQLVFGVETALRGLRRKPFPQRGRWDVSVCLGIFGMFLLANFLVADFIRTPDFCFASLFFFLKLYASGCFALLAGITVILMVCVLLIFFRLSRSNRIETTERVSASRMVYYLALAIISNAFMCPFFFDIGFIDAKTPGTPMALNLSMIASVVANVSGLMAGGLHLFLRSKTLSTIGPSHKGGYDDDRRKLKHKIRVRGVGNHDLGDQVLQPIRRVDSTTTLINSEKEEEVTLDGRSSSAYGFSSTPNPLRSNAVYPVAGLPRSPEPAKVPSITSPRHSRKQSYSLFPNNAPGMTQSVTLLPATTYSPYTKHSARDSLRPPPSMKALTARHKRDSSMASSATVQMVLRLSSAEDIQPFNPRPVDLKNTESLEASFEKGKTVPARPSPLVRAETAPEPATEEDVPVDLPRRSPSKDSRMKTLPPVPSPIAAQVVEVDDGPTLSPSVYSVTSPTKVKVPSPKGVGFTLPSSRYKSGNPRSPPPLRRTNTNGSTPAATDKAEWI